MPLFLANSGVVTVTVDLNFVISLVGLLLAIAVQTWAIVKFMITRADSDKKEVMERIDKETDQIIHEVRNLHEKINGVKEEYLRKDDMERELGRIYKSLADFKFDLTGQLNQLNNRFDTIINALNARKVS